jgi:hypothetical protein
MEIVRDGDHLVLVERALK